ncbi:MAG: ABC transporter ATP-binding protein [Proteobacteria bacterium]|nr:ABC transporter ATP-binding protein [Pseudomonadota bacterium]
MTIFEATQGILNVKQIVKTFGHFKAVDHVSFSIEKGACYGLLGPNGAGKTTTIEMVEGLLSQDSGDILYKQEKRGRRFYEEVGIQFQNTELPHYLTVRETLITFRNLYQRKMDLDELISLCKLEDILHQDNRKISGGQKQRLLLAMAIANDPELLFLDEPTTGLDPQARRHLWDIVFQLKSKNKSIVLTTHYMDEAQILCDTIAIMDHGMFIAEGSPHDLLEEHLSGASLILPSAVKDQANLEGFPWPWFIVRENNIEIQTQDVSSCLAELMSRHIDLTGLIVRPRNLEDLYIKLTGQALRN